MKKIIVILLIVVIYPFAVEARLSEEAIESVGRFLVLDFLTSKSESGEKRKPLTNFFLVKETKDIFTITKEKIEEIQKFKDIIISAGEYKEILIINEVFYE